MAEPVALRYRAFLSYSHADTSWAKWLHRALEAFRVDKDLVGRQTTTERFQARCSRFSGIETISRPVTHSPSRPARRSTPQRR